MKQGIYKICITVCILLIGCLSSCMGDENVPAGNVTNAKKPTLSDIENVVITASSITIKGEVIAHNGYPVTERGICWGTTQNLSIDKDSHKSLTDNNNGIELTTDNLQSNTLYYYCLYAKNQAGVTLGDIASMKTLSGLGSVETIILHDDTRATTARAGGRILDRGEGKILERGVLYYIADDMTTKDSIISTMAEDYFLCNLSGLNPSTKYMIQAYVKNEYGIFSGEAKPLNTRTGWPELSVITKITPKSNQATVYASVLSIGDADIIERGFCWSRAPIDSPTINNEKVLVTFSGTGTGDMEAVLQPLIPKQNYYVSAFARNEFGIAYSPPKYFQTTDDQPAVTTLGYQIDNDNSVTLSGIVTDIGNSNVKTVGIWYSSSTIFPNISGPKVEIVLSPTLSEDSIPRNFSTGKITGLKGGTTYYYCAYAINDNNVPAWGTNSSFTTPPIFTQESGTFDGGTRIEGSSAYFVIGEKGYLLGGDRGPTLANNLYSYTPALLRWDERESYTAGSMRWLTAVVIDDTKVYVLGGSGAGSVDKNDFSMYNAASNWWNPRPTGPPPGHSRVGFALNNEVVYVGGIQGGIAKDEVWGYNVNTDTWTLKTNFPVSQHGGIAVNINNTIYAGLGKNTAGVGYTQLWKSNGALTAWIPEPSGSILSGNVLAGTVFGNKIYVIEKASGKYTIFVYDPATQEWKRKSDLPDNYNWDISFMFTINNRIYIGFADGDKVVSYNPLWDN